MKKWFAVLVGLVLMGGAVAFGAEAETAPLSSPWVPVAGQALTLLLEIAGVAIATLVSWALWRLGKKLGIEKNAALDAMVRSRVKQGINWADAWAKGLAEKPAGKDKKAEAVKFVLGLLAQEGIKTFAKSKIEKIIEAQLQRDKVVAGTDTPTPSDGE